MHFFKNCVCGEITICLLIFLFLQALSKTTGNDSSKVPTRFTFLLEKMFFTIPNVDGRQKKNHTYHCKYNTFFQSTQNLKFQKPEFEYIFYLRKTSE